jgi:hypothetical protein
VSWADQVVLGGLAASATVSLFRITTLLQRIAVALENRR